MNQPDSYRPDLVWRPMRIWLNECFKMCLRQRKYYNKDTRLQIRNLCVYHVYLKPNLEYLY